VCVIFTGKVILTKNLNVFEVENRIIVKILHTKQTVGAKVYSLEGNSPDHSLKYINIIK